MRKDFFGDSYDIVKHTLLEWLGELGNWQAHPMFTETWEKHEAEAFSRLLGVPLVSRELLGPKSNRGEYFEDAEKCPDHLLLDPDTGVRLDPVGGKRARSYLFADELITIATARPRLLTLVYDQSLARGREERTLQRKLRHLAKEGLHGFAYRSHACFVLVGCNPRSVERARTILSRKLSLSRDRLVAPKTQPSRDKPGR